MPNFSYFFKNFGWPELIIILIAGFITIWTHERKNIMRIFKNDREDKEKNQ